MHCNINDAPYSELLLDKTIVHHFIALLFSGSSPFLALAAILLYRLRAANCKYIIYIQKIMRSISSPAAAPTMDEEGSSSPHYYYSTLRRKKNKGRIKHSQLLCVDNNDHGDEQEHYQQQLQQEQDTEDEGGSGGGLLRAINDNERLSHHGGCYRQDEYDCCASLESTAINNTTTTTTSTTTKTKVLILLVVFVITGMIIQLYYDERSVIENNNSNNNNFHHRRDSSSPSTSSSGSSNSNTAAAMASTSTTTTTSTLLTRTSQLSSLLANLDASDVIECYIVTRMANLANVASSSSSSSSSSMNSSNNGGNGGNKKYRRNVQGSDPDDDNIDMTGSTTSSSSSSSSIPTGPILIRKAALAFRYRPKVAHVTPSSGNTASADEATTTTTNPEKYFELTLEYGPQRAGASKTSESMPMVHIDMEIMSNYYDGGDDGSSINNSNNNNNNNNNIGKYVSWDNQGSIYYSTHISNEWSGAYYMSSITGVVLEKILEKVIEYPNKRPRYQPFEVVSLPSNNIILKSSGSDDFVWDMFRDMADLYVDIDPILVPPRGKVQFYVADPEEEGIEEENNIGGGEKKTMKQKRHLPNPNVKRVKGVIESSKAAAFYENFFNCASAKKTGDYSMYLPPLVTTSLAPSPVPPVIDEDSNVPTTTTAAASNGSDKADNVDDGGSRRRLDEDVEKVPSNSTNVDLLVDENKRVPKGVENSSKSSPNKSEDVVKTAEVVSGDDVDATKIDEGEEKISMSPQLDYDDDDDDYDKEIEITDPDAVEMTDPDEDHVASEDDGDAAKAAEKAAIEAAEKAEAAAAVAATNSSSPEDSAKAASEAAIAAKKAADATVAARAKSSAEGLLSGDGTLMTSILSSCFSDPKYGIRKMHANDGANDLTGSEQSTQIPSTYAYVYLDGDVFIRLNLTAPYWGTSSVLQTVPPPHAKVDGRGDVVDWAIFLLLMVATVFGFVVIVHQLGVVIDKRLQFRHVFHPLGDDDSVEMERLEKGGGLPHSIGIDAIPVSLGGKLSHYDGDKGHGPPTSYKDRLSDSSIGDERNGLLDIELATREKIVTVNSPKLASPNASDLPTSLRLKEEAPDLVERPTLKSMSKVALPHTSPRNDQERVPRRRSLEIDTDMPRLPSIS